MRDGILDDLNSNDLQKQLQGTNTLLQLSAVGKPPAVSVLLPTLHKPELARPVRILLYHLLRTCKTSEDLSAWEQAFVIMRRDIEQRDSVDVQIAAIKSIASFPHKLIASKLKCGELTLWGRDPLQLRSVVRLAFVEALGQVLLSNTVAINDPIISTNGWIDIVRSLFDTSHRVISCGFQMIGRLFSWVSGQTSEPFFDSRVDLAPLLYHSAQLVLRVASDQLPLLIRTFSRLKPHHRLSVIVPYSEILLQHVSLERRSFGKAFGVFGHFPFCLSFAQFFALLDCLDVPLVFEAGRAIIKFAQARLIDPGLVSTRVLPVFLNILSTRPEEIPKAYRTHVAEFLIPLVELLPSPEYQLDAFLRIFFLVCKLPYLAGRLRALLLFFHQLIKLSLRWYTSDIPQGSPDDALPSSLFIERFLNNQRIYNILANNTSPGGADAGDVKLLRKDLLIALLTCYFEFTTKPLDEVEDSSASSSSSTRSQSSGLSSSSSSSLSSSSSSSLSSPLTARSRPPIRPRAARLPVTSGLGSQSLSSSGHSLLEPYPDSPTRLSGPHARSTTVHISSALLDVGLRIFIRNVSCIHWSLEDSTLPLELYLKLFRYLFEVFSVHPNAPPSLHSKFYSFIIGGIGSVSVLRVVPSFSLFLSVISIFGTHIRRLIELTSSSGSKNLMQKANELPLKLLQLVDSFLTPPSEPPAAAATTTSAQTITRTAILEANLIPQLLETVAALATCEALKSVAVEIIEKIYHEPLVAVHRRQCSLYIQQLCTPDPQTPRKPSAHLLSKVITPRDLHYFMHASLYLTGDSIPTISTKALSKQRRSLMFQTVSGSSDPVLVELCCLANLQYSRLSFFVKLTNTTPLPLTHLSVLVETGGNLRTTPDSSYFRVGVLGFRQSMSLRFPVSLTGLYQNAIHIAVVEQAQDADRPRLTRTSTFVPPLSLFIHSCRPERTDFLHSWQIMASVFHIDGYLEEGVAQSQLIQQLCRVTGFAYVMTHRSRQTDLPTYGLFGISWFADLFAFAITFNFSISQNQHIFRIHAKCTPRLADLFSHFLRNSLASIPGRIARTVEPGQRDSQFTDFDGFPPFEELLLNQN